MAHCALLLHSRWAGPLQLDKLLLENVRRISLPQLAARQYCGHIIQIKAPDQDTVTGQDSAAMHRQAILHAVQANAAAPIVAHHHTRGDEMQRCHLERHEGTGTEKPPGDTRRMASLCSIPCSIRVSHITCPISAPYAEPHPYFSAKNFDAMFFGRSRDDTRASVWHCFDVTMPHGSHSAPEESKTANLSNIMGVNVCNKILGPCGTTRTSVRTIPAKIFGTLGVPLSPTMIVVMEAEVHHSECGLEEDEELSISKLESSLPDNTVL